MTLKQHFSKAEVLSVIQTFVAFLAIDASMQFNAVINGDWSESALLALGAAVLRSALKYGFSLVMAKLKSPLPPGPTEVEP